MTDVTHIVNLEEGYFKVNFSFLFPIIKHKTKSRTNIPSCPMSMLLACTMQPFAHSHDMQRIAPDRRVTAGLIYMQLALLRAQIITPVSHGLTLRLQI